MGPPKANIAELMMKVIGEDAISLMRSSTLNLNSSGVGWIKVGRELHREEDTFSC